jgi:beta-barrel assembly-enhancing protease
LQPTNFSRTAESGVLQSGVYLITADDEPVEDLCGLYTWAMDGSVFYKLGRIAGVQVRKARWMWESVAGNEADSIRAEQAVGSTMAATVLEGTARDSDRATQALLDEIGARLAAVVRNRLHRFEMTAIDTERPTAFALPGGFIFVAGSLVRLCDRNKDDIAFVLAHEMSHVMRRHAIERLLQQKIVNAVALASPARGALASWIRKVGIQGLERAYSQDEEFEADELGVLLMRAAGFDVAGAIRMLQCLGALDRHPDPLGLNRYLSTHPPIEERVNRLRRLTAG